MEGLAAFLLDHGCVVSVPTLPGHATQPEDLRNISYQQWIETSEKAFYDLQQQHPRIFVIGQSMGGTLALHLAAHHRFGGVVTLAAAIRLSLRQEMAIRLLTPFISVRHKPNGSDVRDLNGKARLRNYDRYPMSAARQLLAMLRHVRAELPAVKMPVLAIHSPWDHVVPFENLALLQRLVSSPTVEPMVVENSYHVLTVDHDHQMIFARIWEFVTKHSTSE